MTQLGRQSIPKSQRGAAMLAALCLAMVFALSLSSYLALCYTSLKMSTRNIMSAHSIELAENGVEMALYSENHTDWTGWTLSGGNATAVMVMTNSGLVAAATNPTPLNFGNGTSGQVNIAVRGYNTLTPAITSQGMIFIAEAGSYVTVSRTITCGPSSALGTSAAPLFVNAVAATTDKVTFSAGGTLDSYTSMSPLGIYQAYGSTAVGASAVVLSGDTTSASPTVALNNAVVNGYVVGFDPFYPGSTNWLSYGGTGKVVGPSSAGSTYIDSSRIVTSPVPYQPEFTENPPPYSSDLPVACCIGSTNILTQTSTLGNPAAGLTSPSVYHAAAIDLAGTLSIVGPVVLIVDSSAVIEPGGGIQLTTATASLQIFVDNDKVTLGGAGISFSPSVPMLPKRISILSTTNQTGNKVTFSTNTPFYGVIYFPNLEIDVTSANPVIFGSIIGKTVIFTHSPVIHYDVALRSPDSILGDAAFDYMNSPFTVGTLVASAP